MSMSGIRRSNEKWIKHYSSAHTILLVGEGDFSFSVCLGQTFGSATNIVATSLDSYDELINKYKNAKANLETLKALGASLLHGVDATQMMTRPDLHSKKFHRIIYNFPHAGFYGKEDDPLIIMMHRDLVCGYLRNASSMLRLDGEIHVSHKITAPFDSWRIEDLGAECSLVCMGQDVFRIEDYPGYNNKRGSGSRADEPFPLGACRTFEFKLYPADEENLTARQMFPTPLIGMQQTPVSPFTPQMFPAPCIGIQHQLQKPPMAAQGGYFGRPDYQFEYRDEEQQSRYLKLREATLLPTKFVDEMTLEEIGIKEDVATLLEEANLLELARNKWHTHRTITLEFLSSLKLVGAWNDGYPNIELHFRMLGEERSLSLEDFATNLGLSTGEAAKRPNHFNVGEFWREISYGRYFVPNQESVMRVRHPIIRYLHLVISTCILARGDFKFGVPTDELLILWSILHQQGLNIAFYMVLHLYKVGTTFPDIILCGGIVTAIAGAVGVRTVTMPIVNGGMSIDNEFLERHGMVYKKDRQLYWQICDGSSMVVPNSYATSMEFANWVLIYFTDMETPDDIEEGDDPSKSPPSRTVFFQHQLDEVSLSVGEVEWRISKLELKSQKQDAEPIHPRGMQQTPCMSGIRGNKEKWMKNYSSAHDIPLVGDFSISLCLGSGKNSSSIKNTNVVKEGDSEGKEAENVAGNPDSAAAKAIAAPPTRHPLENSWTFWISNPSVKSKRAARGSSIRPVYTFSSVEDFWRVYNNIHHPRKLAVGADFHCFKEKIEPNWEDPVCANGGKWTVSFSKGGSDTCWLHTLLAMIGEQFDYGDEICGAAVHVRTRRDKIALWTKNAANEAAQLSIGRRWKEFLDYNDQVGFIFHADAKSLRRGTKNRYTV